MAGNAKVSGPASYLPAIEHAYGKPITHSMSVLKKAGVLKHMELVTLLKTEHTRGHGTRKQWSLLFWQTSSR